MSNSERPVRVMIAGDDEPLARQVAELLVQQGHQVASGLVIPLSLAADRASRMNADLLVVSIAGDIEAAVSAIRETRNSSGAYIIGIGPAHDPRLILKCLHDGADEYLDSALLADELLGGLARMKAKRLSRLGGFSHGKVISAIGVSGGAGATTVAANMAGLLARKSAACGLVDLRLHSGDLASLLNLKPLHTVADFCVHTERVDRSMFDQMFTPHGSGLELLAAPLDPRQANVVTAQGIRLMVAMGRAKFRYLVLDVDNRLDDVQLEALWQSDLILAVTRLDFISIRSGRRLLDRLEDAGIEPERIRVVANRFGQPRELPVAQAEAALGVKIASFLADDPRRVNRSSNEGKLVAMAHSWSSISRNFHSLAAAVNGRPSAEEPRG